MSRTLGALDLYPRRKRSITRSDKGKRRELYRGKPVKKKRKHHGKLVLYKSKRKPWDALKFEFWDIIPMSLNGLHHYRREVRGYVLRTVYGRNKFCFTIDPEDINTKEKFEEFLEEHLYPGNWGIFMRVHAKNPWHNSPKMMATAIIKKTSNGNVASLTPSYKNRGLFRYSWWWKG